MVDERRIRALNDKAYLEGPVMYVMGRDFRVRDNWALLHAQELAFKHQQPLCVLIHVGKNLAIENERQWAFLVGGLIEVIEELSTLSIPFYATSGDTLREVKTSLKELSIGHVVTDFSPLKEQRSWLQAFARDVNVPVSEVDAHNIIPVFVTSQKEEFAAHTIRPKIKRLYREFAGAIPKVKLHPYSWPEGKQKVIDWEKLKKAQSFVKVVKPINWCKPGGKAAHKVLLRFLNERIGRYAEKRNDPNEQVLSDLSPYVRHGFISAQRVAHSVELHKGDRAGKEAFLEELVVRRELAENFCCYNEHYDSFVGLRDWAKRTLDAHRKDKREFIYTLAEFEEARTHDELWNAAQTQMVETGKMHGYIRMYWAKKILEWSKTPEVAIETAVLLNDRYSIDGRDPNGYVGVMWSIGGIHDRAWFNRDVFGMIRYMNYNGAKKKFDVKAYIAKYLTKQATLV